MLSSTQSDNLYPTHAGFFFVLGGGDGRERLNNRRKQAISLEFYQNNSSLIFRIY